MATTDAASPPDHEAATSSDNILSSLTSLDAMDATTYCKILEKRGQQPYFQEDGAEFNDGIMAFRHDLLKFKVVWFNDWKKDWICWQRNNHALYSILKCPKYHEYSARERAVTFVCASIIFSIAAVIAVIVENNMLNSNSDSFSIFLAVNAINLAGGISAGLVEGILKECATCACAQGLQDESVTQRMERIGHVFIGFYAFVSLGACVGGVVVASSYGLVGKYVLGWSTGILAFLIVPTILLTVIFHLLWKQQSKEENMGDNSKFMVCASEYRAYVGVEESVRKDFPSISERKKVGGVMKVVSAKNLDA